MPDRVAWPTRPLFPLGRESAHSQIDTSKMDSELGYRDVVPAETALRRTARWYWDNGDLADAQAGSEDPFDYAAEDRLLEFFDGFIDEYESSYARTLAPSVHPYPHPVSPGQPRDQRGR